MLCKKLATLAFAWMGLMAGVALPAAAVDPKTGDLSTILSTRSDELAVWRYAGNPNVYIFDFPGLGYQGRTFNRITQLTEQFNEPYPRVLTVEEMNQYMEAVRRTEADFAFGNDVLVSELVLFFNLADRDKVELLPEELALRDFAVEQGLIRIWRGIHQAMRPDAVILSIPQMQAKKEGEPKITSLARTAILMHELAHGEYYTNSYYANYCRKFWNETLTDNQRDAFTRFLSKYNYSVNQGELMVNEMQAYLMFTPDPSSFNAGLLGIPDEELEQLRQAFRKGKPPTRLPLI